MLKTIVLRRFAQLIWAIAVSVGLSATLSAQPVKISGSMVTGGDVVKSAFSADGLYAVFIADKDTDGKDELYRVRISTGVVTKLSGALVTGGRVISFQISPDSSRVVFYGDKDTFNVFELYSTPIASSAPIKISGTIVAGGTVNSYKISPDSARVVFTAEQDTDDVLELYSTPIASSAPIKLSGTLVVDGDVGASDDDFKISPDSTRVVFRADKDTEGTAELYSTPIASSAPIKISGTLVSGGNVGLGGLQISGDSTRVVFLADKDTVGVLELYSTPISSSAPIKISGALVAGGAVRAFKISPDSARVVFTADKDTDAIVELYSTPIASSVPIKISGTMVAGGNVAFGSTDFQISPDSVAVVFRADKDTDGVSELYSTPISSSAAIKISGPLVAGGIVSSFLISPDSDTVVFRADKDTDNVNELYSTPIASSASVKISGALVANGSVLNGYQISADSSRVMFIADKDTDNVNELYRVQIGGTALALDFDADDQVLMATDVLMLTRYLRGVRGSALVADATGVNATLTTSFAIEARIRDALAVARP